MTWAVVGQLAHESANHIITQRLSARLVWGCQLSVATLLAASSDRVVGGMQTRNCDHKTLGFKLSKQVISSC